MTTIGTITTRFMSTFGASFQGDRAPQIVPLGPTHSAESIIILTMNEVAKGSMHDLMNLQARVQENNRAKKELRDLRSALGSMPVDGEKKVSLTREQVLSALEKGVLFAELKTADGKALKDIPAEEQGKAVAGLIAELKNGGDAGNSFPYKIEKDALNTNIDNAISSLSDIGEELSLKIQLAMSKYQQAMQMMTNLSKKFDDVANSIIANLK